MSVSNEILEVAKALQVEVKTPKLWQAALTHPSYAHEHPDHGESYERLEFLGDAVIGAAVAEKLYHEQPQSPPGQLTFLRSVVVRREHLAEWAKTLPLEGAVRFGKSAKSLDQQGLQTALADVAEALLAVVFLEHGAAVLARLISQGIARHIPSYAEARAQLEPKNVLQELLAARGIETPVYNVVAIDAQSVTVEVAWSGGSVQASGRSKREATVAAARQAVLLLHGTTSHA